MSRTMIISSWPASNTTSSSSIGSRPTPEKSSAYISATRSGVRARPARSGSSPMASRIARTFPSTLCASNGAVGRSSVTTSLRSFSGWSAISESQPHTRDRSSGDLSGRLEGKCGLNLAEAGLGRRQPAPAALGLGRRGRVLAFALLTAQAVALHRVGRALLGDLGEDLGDLFLLERLLLDQAFDHELELVAVLREDLVGLVVGLVDEAMDLRVDAGGDVVGVVLYVSEVAPQERLRLVLTEREGAEVRHSVLRHHLLRDPRAALNV